MSVTVFKQFKVLNYSQTCLIRNYIILIREYFEVFFMGHLTVISKQCKQNRV